MYDPRTDPFRRPGSLIEDSLQRNATTALVDRGYTGPVGPDAMATLANTPGGAQTAANLTRMHNAMATTNQATQPNLRPWAPRNPTDPYARLR